MALRNRELHATNDEDVWARQTNSVLISKTAALSVDTVLCCCTQGENVYDSMHKTWMRLRRLAETEAV